jgi:hypothetical protein
LSFFFFFILFSSSLLFFLSGGIWFRLLGVVVTGGAFLHCASLFGLFDTMASEAGGV